MSLAGRNPLAAPQRAWKFQKQTTRVSRKFSRLGVLFIKFWTFSENFDDMTRQTHFFNVSVKNKLKNFNWRKHRKLKNFNWRKHRNRLDMKSSRKFHSNSIMEFRRKKNWIRFERFFGFEHMKLYKKVSRTRIVISTFNQKSVKGRNEDKAEKWFSAKILGKLKIFSFQYLLN